MKMLFQYTNNPERSSNPEMYSSWDSESDGFSENCVVDKQQKRNLRRHLQLREHHN